MKAVSTAYVREKAVPTADMCDRIRPPCMSQIMAEFNFARSTLLPPSSVGRGGPGVSSDAGRGAQRIHGCRGGDLVGGWRQRRRGVAAARPSAAAHDDRDKEQGGPQPGSASRRGEAPGASAALAAALLQAGADDDGGGVDDEGDAGGAAIAACDTASAEATGCAEDDGEAPRRP